MFRFRLGLVEIEIGSGTNERSRWLGEQLACLAVPLAERELHASEQILKSRRDLAILPCGDVNSVTDRGRMQSAVTN
ncbi:hypothetical protein [Rubripirellula reticaptiva]|uniref:hypothetical protein n=1 Tax=Rubripirellula reticaptiva TaxID=2528013 RepID=UPI0016484ACA|nr:hypothetical protein [Rubripirellula reticaptiva]